jgi:hypothetical protein
MGARLRGPVETDQNFAGHAPCRYRVPFDAPRDRPTLWSSHSPSSHFTFPLILTPLQPSTTHLLIARNCIGCCRSRPRHHRLPAGEEALAREEGPWYSSQIGSRLGFSLAVYCDLAVGPSSCIYFFMSPTTSNICALRLDLCGVVRIVAQVQVITLTLHSRKAPA